MKYDIRVSLSGADESAEISSLHDMLRAYPFTELGIQMLPGREGVPHYPSHEWIKRLMRLVSSDVLTHGRITLHINKEYCRSILSGKIPDDVLNVLYAQGGENAVRKMQLNFRPDCGTNAEELSLCLTLLESNGIKAIIQSHPATAVLLYETNKLMPPEFSGYEVLHDTSEGKGIRPAQWPAQRPGCFNSWAGGITPESVTKDISRIIKSAVPPFGIDAESGLRDINNRRIFSIPRACAMAQAAAACGMGFCTVSDHDEGGSKPSSTISAE